MRDPEGLCIHRGYWHLAQPNISQSKPSVAAEPRKSAHDSSDVPHNCLPPITDNDLFGLHKSAHLGFTEKSLVEGRNTASRRDPLLRSCSCNGRIERLSPNAKKHPRKVSLNTECFSTPQSTRSSEPGQDLPFEAGEHRHAPRKPVLESNKGDNAKAGNIVEALQSKLALECTIVVSEIAVDSKFESTETRVPASAVKDVTKAVTFASPIACYPCLGKRHLGTEDGDSSATLNLKRSKLKKAKVLMDLFKCIETATFESYRQTLNPIRSIFQHSEWSSIDPNMFDFAPAEPKVNSYVAAETSVLMPSVEAQVSIKTEPSSPMLSTTSSVDTVQQENDINIAPIPFICTLDKFNEVIPGCDAKRRFQDRPNWCLANKKDGTRCQWRMPPFTQDVIAESLILFERANWYANMQTCCDGLVAFTNVAVCHHQQDSIKWKLKSLLRKSSSASSSQVVPVMSTPPVKSIQASETSETGLIMQQRVPQLISNDKHSIASSAIKVTYWLPSRSVPALNYLPEYRSYQPSDLHHTTPRERVIEQAERSLFTNSFENTGYFRELDERKDGYLYIYWNRASFGLVKIGCTTFDVDERLRQWEGKCHHLAEELYRSPFRIKHVARVEKLIHAEFEEQRVFEPFCHGCGGKHIEWFRGLDLQSVIQRVETWTDWIMKEPYEERLGHWRLKDGFELPPPKTTCGIKYTEKGKLLNMRESPRYNLRRRRTPGSPPVLPSPNNYK